MNILMTTTILPRWKNDSELRIVLEIAENIKKNNHNLNIFILAPHCQGAKKFERINGVKIIRYQYFWERWQSLYYDGGMLFNIRRNKLNFFLIPISFIAQILAVKKFVKRENIDILHAHWLIPQGLIAVLYKKVFNKNIKILCTGHGIDIFVFKNKFFNYLRYFVLKNCDAVTGVSTFIKKEIIKYKINSNKVFVINNGIDWKFFAPQKSGENLKKQYNITSYCLLFVGRLTQKKGVNYLISAIPKILFKFPHAKLLIVGYGPDIDVLKQQAKKLQLQKNIIFAGKINREQIPAYYQIADIFIGPSIISPRNNDAEGFGLVFLESLACGTPVITTNSGGMTDIIKHNFSGLTVSPKNPEAISDSVNDLLSNFNKRKKFSENGKKIVRDKFDWKKIVSEYVNLYYKIQKENK